jgi:hypothetical protein
LDTAENDDAAAHQSYRHRRFQAALDDYLSNRGDETMTPEQNPKNPKTPRTPKPGASSAAAGPNRPASLVNTSFSFQSESADSSQNDT